MRLLPYGVLVCALSVAPSTLAQRSGVSTAPVAALSSLAGDGSDAISPFGFQLSLPLVLSLEASIPPMAREFPNCASREDDAGNSIGGIPIQHYAELRLTPRLVLSAFTQLGCPIDAGVGAAFTYAVPVRASAWLVFGGGLYAAPAQTALFGGLQPSLLQGLRGTDSPARVAGRVDVVWNAHDGHPYHLGVQSLGVGRQQVTFGSGF